MCVCVCVCVCSHARGVCERECVCARARVVCVCVWSVHIYNDKGITDTIIWIHKHILYISYYIRILHRNFPITYMGILRKCMWIIGLIKHIYLYNIWVCRIIFNKLNMCFYYFSDLFSIYYIFTIQLVVNFRKKYSSKSESIPNCWSMFF